MASPAPLPSEPVADDLRIDAVSGRRVGIVGTRQGRPNLPDHGCPFCVGGAAAPEPYAVRHFVNHWPAMPDDRCEVVLYTSDHDASFGSLELGEARRVIDLWAERTDLLGSRPDVAYVLVFENRGREVGATIDHPHGQIYAYPAVPPIPLEELGRDLSDGLIGDAPGDRLVAEVGEWRAWVPEAASWPFELIVAPRRPTPDLPALTTAQRDDLARILIEVHRDLDSLFEAPMPLMQWFHQRPTDGGDWPNAWLHLHIAPVLRAPGVERVVAAAEVGGGVFFNPVDPSEAAARLRQARPSPSP